MLFGSSRMRVTYNRTVRNFDRIVRYFADNGPTKDGKSKTIQGMESDKLRVRRVRSQDIPRVLRFVRDNSSASWPGVTSAPAAPVIVTDFIYRSLVQGHSMLAELRRKQEGTTGIRGVALGTATCPWDASLLQKWSRCISCEKSRTLMSISANCLESPCLHSKYNVPKILQVILLIPTDAPNASYVAQQLVQHSIKRAKDVKFPLVRIDVSDSAIVKSLENLDLTKEWAMSKECKTPTFESKILADQGQVAGKKDDSNTKKKHPLSRNLTVFSAFTGLDTKPAKNP